MCVIVGGTEDVIVFLYFVGAIDINFIIIVITLVFLFVVFLQIPACHTHGFGCKRIVPLGTERQ